MTELCSSSEALIGYSGTVVTELRKGDIILDRRRYHNSGLSPLFNGLSKLLAGNSDAVLAKVQPYHIALYTLPSSSTANTETSWNKLFPSLTRVTPYLPVSSRTFKDDEAIFSFNIPSDLISTNRPIYVLALYPVSFDSAEPMKDALAFYKLANGDRWQEVTVNVSNTLLIEWRMNFTNKEASTYEH